MRQLLAIFANIRMNCGKRVCGATALCVTMTIALPAQTLTTLHSFDGTDGYGPMGALAQGTNGYLYGTTAAGGEGNCGTVFKIGPGGKQTPLDGLCSDGGSPFAGLVQATNGYLYGTTSGGTVFKMTPGGNLTPLQSGLPQPTGALVQAFNGNLYGTTRYGGNMNSACAGGSCGTIFEMTASGSLTTLYSFCSKPTARTARTPSRGWSRPPMGTFTGQHKMAG